MEIVIKAILRHSITYCAGAHDIIKKLSLSGPCGRKRGFNIKRIRNAFKPFCADAKLDQKEPVIGYPCHGQGTNQYWMLTKENEIRRDSCWDSPDGRRITIYNCHGQHGNQMFMYMEDDTIRSKTYNKCVELSLNGKEIYLAECNKSPRQQWKWNRKPMHGPTRD